MTHPKSLRMPPSQRPSVARRRRARAGGSHHCSRPRRAGTETLYGPSAGLGSLTGDRRSALTHSTSIAPSNGETSTSAVQLESVILWTGLCCQPITSPGCGCSVLAMALDPHVSDLRLSGLAHHHFSVRIIKHKFDKRRRGAANR